MRILVVEDNPKMADSLVRGFTQEGYAADSISNGEDAEKRALMNHRDYDVIVLDITLPGKNGMDVCASLREKGVMTPVIMLTARDTVENKIAGLDSGADDYLIKPFSFGELLARVRALTRRPRNSLPPELIVGDLTLKPADQTAYKGSKKLNLTLTEFRLLEFFMSKPDELVTRQQLIDHLWDFHFNPLSRTMDVHINNVRAKIGDKHGKILQTVRGVGYRFTA